MGGRRIHDPLRLARLARGPRHRPRAWLGGAEAAPAEPGVFWVHTAEMQMAGFSMPAQTMKVCLPKEGLENPPGAGGGGQGCKTIDVNKSGSRMTWKLKCEDGTSGEGELTSGSDSYAGSMTMRTQGRELRMKLTGKRVGGDCDASETRRQLEALQQPGTGRADREPPKPPSR